MDKERELIRSAKSVRRRAVATYSKFKVGAAVLAADGGIHEGCNVENSTYGLTVCAERVAIFKALSEGVRKFRMIAVVADTDPLTPPCGACRQIIWEFCGDVPVVLANLRGGVARYRMSQLLPLAFDRKLLKRASKP
ncbi:MAG: cytidine deaminase [Acidobacteria bacterium]|nr:cytidine deaminase [Acidobacteriota bacterium]